MLCNATISRFSVDVLPENQHKYRAEREYPFANLLYDEVARIYKEKGGSGLFPSLFPVFFSFYFFFVIQRPQSRGL